MFVTGISSILMVNPVFNDCPLNLFIPSAPFLYPPEISENRKVFWCFQGIEKGCIGNKWVNERHSKGKFVCYFYSRFPLANLASIIPELLSHFLLKPEF